jgi:hypothetical protein
VVAARLLRLSVSPSLRASPRCAAETRSERTSPLMRMGYGCALVKTEDSCGLRRRAPRGRARSCGWAVLLVASLPCRSVPGLRSNAV